MEKKKQFGFNIIEFLRRTSEYLNSIDEQSNKDKRLEILKIDEFSSNKELLHNLILIDRGRMLTEKSIINYKTKDIISQDDLEYLLNLFKLICADTSKD